MRAPGLGAPDPTTAAGDARPGVNVVGYLRAETGVGEAGRALVRALRYGGHPVTCIAVASPDGARQADISVGPLTTRPVHDITILCVNAGEVPTVRRELGPAFFERRYTIGLWFWELDVFPPTGPWRDGVDEVWTASRFVQTAIAPTMPCPVINVGLAVSAPTSIAAPKARLGLGEDRPVVTFAFDALSVLARKNPMAVVDAFRLACGRDGRRAQLVIKASRLDLYPAEHRVLAEAVSSVGGRLFDRYLDRAGVAALFHASDIYVSLHRSEGFGLTLAEAMAVGTPVVATGYSGNLDFMTPDTGALVRWARAEVPSGAGPYPQGAHWAEPDIDDAAAHLARLIQDPAEARALGRRGADAIARSHGLAAIGARITARLATLHARRRRLAA